MTAIERDENFEANWLQSQQDFYQRSHGYGEKLARAASFFDWHMNESQAFLDYAKARKHSRAHLVETND